MRIDVFGCSTQRRNAMSSVVALFLNRLLGIETASRILVRITYVNDDERIDPVTRLEDIWGYEIELPIGGTILQDCIVVARGCAVIAQYVTKRRHLVQNCPTKVRWSGETYDVIETKLADNPIFIDAIGVGELLCMELRDQLPSRSVQN